MISLKNKSKYFTIVFSSLMLALSLICSMISNVFPFILGSSFLRIDIGISFLALNFMISGWKYGTLVVLSNFIIHPFLPGTNIGFIQLFFIGKTIFLITCLIYVFFNFVIYKVINKKNLITPIFISSFLTTIIITILNGLLFTPLFFNIISNGQFSMNFVELAEQYKTSWLQTLFIVPNYWGGIALIYGTFNIVSLGLNSWILLILTKITHSFN